MTDRSRVSGNLTLLLLFTLQGTAQVFDMRTDPQLAASYPRTQILRQSKMVVFLRTILRRNWQRCTGRTKSRSLTPLMEDHQPAISCCLILKRLIVLRILVI